MKFLRKYIFTLENLLAFVFAIIVILLLIFTTKTPPSWIYQGF
jgi:hypothetical protein